MDKLQVFNTLQAGGGTVNPLSALGTIANGHANSVITQISTLQNASALKQEALNKAGISDSYIASAQTIMSGNLNDISSLVTYGGTSAQNFYSRVNIAKNYVSAMDRFGISEDCSPYQSVIGIIGGVGQSVLSKANEAVGAASSKLQEFLNSSEVQDLEALANDLKNTLDAAFDAVATFSKEVVDYIAEEAALLEKYATTAINAAITSVLGDWVNTKCISDVMDVVLSPEVRGYL